MRIMLHIALISKALMIGTAVASAATSDKKPPQNKAAPPSASSGKPSKPATVVKPDLATEIAGTWQGDVTSDMMGSSRDNVPITITRTAANIVTITSSYKRLPVVTVPLMRASGRTIARNGKTTIFFDPTANPVSLDVVFNGEVAWRGYR
jgi:hypothetical protein